MFLQNLRDECADNGSGASEERGGMLVSGNNFTISNAQIREAINLSAWYPDFGWDPTSGTMPISPAFYRVLEQVEGLVNPSNIEPIIAHLNQSSSLGDRPSDVEACMSANQEMRESYWGADPTLESSTHEIIKEEYATWRD